MAGLDLLIDRYTYRVSWSVPDELHLGRCAEYPSLAKMAPTREAALAGVRQLVAQVTADRRASGAALPAPLAEKRFSGEFRLRIPPGLHRSLALEAALDRVSLNQMVCTQLALAVKDSEFAYPA